MILQISSFAIALSGPVSGSLQGSYVTLFSVRLPFLNHYPDIEYHICMVWETLNGILAFFGFISMETKFCILNNAINVSSDLSAHYLRQLSADIERNYGTTGQWIDKLRAVFKRELRMDGYDLKMTLLQTYLFIKLLYSPRFIREFRDVMYWRLFLCPPILTFSISLAIFCQYTVLSRLVDELLYLE